MSNKAKLIIALGLAGLSIACLVGLFSSKSSVRSYIASHYQSTAASAVPGATSRSLAYTSPAPPSQTAAKIASAWKPAQESDQGSGNFLRYKSGIVAVTPNGQGGSYITLDDPNDGYARWFPFVGGTWGTSAGRGETFRGGGPGSGK
jgi:hypothetical protein